MIILSPIIKCRNKLPSSGLAWAIPGKGIPGIPGIRAMKDATARGPKDAERRTKPPGKRFKPSPADPLARDKLYSLKYFNLLAKARPAKSRDGPEKQGCCGGWVG